LSNLTASAVANGPSIVTTVPLYLPAKASASSGPAGGSPSTALGCSGAAVGSTAAGASVGAAAGWHAANIMLKAMMTLIIIAHPLRLFIFCSFCHKLSLNQILLE
jgi:hypothetical protein